MALTFDAEHPDRSWCPPGNVEHILDVLGEAEVRATFFVQGRWAESQPEVTRRIAEDGHLVGHHSHYHARMPLLSDDGIRSDLLEAQTVITEITGQDPRPWFRCPFGAGTDDPRLLAVLRALGYRNVHWNVEAQDWEPSRRGPTVAEGVIAGVERHGGGAIVLLHTWPGGTGQGIDRIVGDLRERGATFVSIEDLEVVT